MTVKQLKELIAGMDDAALVLARDRDNINLTIVDVVAHPQGKAIEHLAISHENVSTVYGGEDWIDRLGDRQAIIFCDCD
jgi:hypothetical protein